MFFWTRTQKTYYNFSSRAQVFTPSTSFCIYRDFSTRTVLWWKEINHLGTANKNTGFYSEDSSSSRSLRFLLRIRERITTITTQNDWCCLDDSKTKCPVTRTCFCLFTCSYHITYHDIFHNFMEFFLTHNFSIFCIWVFCSILEVPHDYTS